MLWLQSRRTTVAQELWYSHWWTMRSEQVLQGLESKKIDGLVGDFEARFGLGFVRLAELAARGSLRRRRDLRRLLRIDETFVGQAFSEFIEVDGVGGFAYVFAVADEFHGRDLGRSTVDSRQLTVKKKERSARLGMRL